MEPLKEYKAFQEVSIDLFKKAFLWGSTFAPSGIFLKPPQGHPIDCLDNFGQTPLFRAADAGRDEAKAEKGKREG